MVRANPDVLVALGSEPVLQACMAASRSVPIIFVANNYDPIARGYVQGLAKAGGNVTGVFLRQTELAEKQVELLTQAFPDRTRLAVLFDAVSADQFVAAEHRAKLLGLQVHSRKLENPPYDFDAAIQSAVDARSNMLLVLSSPFFGRQRERIAEFSVRQRLPAMFVFKGYVEAGGSCPMERTAWPCTARAGPMLAKFSRALSLRTSPSNSRTSMKWWSISRPPKRWDLNCRLQSWCAPTR
jgi:putative tryptophan/tyrosine transport system substrate-binding protein